jgi:flavin reductase (DIM6/NTAB) family NADH-FMN oxidoreductase RutF
MRIDVELAKAYRLINHGPVTLVSSAHAGKRNVMAAAWVMPLDFEPPKVLAVIDGRCHSRKLIEASGEFALSIPPSALAKATIAAGSASGDEVDKFEYTGLATFPAQKISAPLIEGCVAWLECRLLDEPRMRDRYDLMIAEVVAAQADDRVFDGSRWRFDDDTLRTLHHVAGGAFFATGNTVAVDESQ